MKVVVTGAQGQVGSEVILAFKQQGHVVIALGSKDLDVTDAVQVERVLQQHQDSQFVINCAAYTAVDKAEREPSVAMAINAFGVQNLASSARHFQIPLIHISTDYVFDGQKASAYSEDDMPNPQSVYGQSKLQGEVFLRSTWDRHIILRVSWVFGRFGHNFVKTMLRLFAERSELGIVNDQSGCPTGAHDIAAAILTLCERNLELAKWGTYHFCGCPVTTWYDFARHIYQLAQGQFFDNTCTIKAIATSAYPTPAKRPKNSELLVQKITRDFDIAVPSWEQALNFMLAELRK